MRKHLAIRVLGLFVISSVLADQLVEPAFSTSLTPFGGVSATRPFNQAYFTMRNQLGAPRPHRPSHQPSLNGWVADFSHRQAMQVLRTDTTRLDEISLFAVGATMKGELAPETEFIRLAMTALNKLPTRPRVLLTVANNRPRRVQDRWLIHHWFGSGEKWTRHAHDLLQLVDPVDGLDIDYENLRPGDVEAYSQFLMYLGYRLHARGKYLTVSVEAQTFLTAGFDWKTLSQSVDRVRIMAYPYHYERTNPGAVSPPDIVEKLAKKALHMLPAEKLEIGLPIFGYDWSGKGQGRVIAMTAHYDRLANLPGAHVFRDPTTQSARVDYQQEKVRHQVWYEDPVSVAHKVHRLHDLGIVHIGFWQLGVGDVTPLFDLVESPQSRRRTSSD